MHDAANKAKLQVHMHKTPTPCAHATRACEASPNLAHKLREDRHNRTRGESNCSRTTSKVCRVENHTTLRRPGFITHCDPKVHGGSTRARGISTDSRRSATPDARLVSRDHAMPKQHVAKHLTNGRHSTTGRQYTPALPKPRPQTAPVQTSALFHV